MFSFDFDHPDVFVSRHIGPDEPSRDMMLKELGYSSLDSLVDDAIPHSIRRKESLNLKEPLSESEMVKLAQALGEKNRKVRSLIGMGYYDCITPAVIVRNILQNPGWYTQYTPYQAEISQGRLEALLNFQTMVADLTALPIANASLLDEASAAAEAMNLALHFSVDENEKRGRSGRKHFFVAEDCHPQILSVVQTKASALGLIVETGPVSEIEPKGRLNGRLDSFFGALVSYPNTYGEVSSFETLASLLHDHRMFLVVASDLLSLTLLKPPGEWGADVCIGSTQRFGLPLGAGGPHAAFFATKQEYLRKLPGRIIGVSEDAHKKTALRMALQTREQHIRREKATSNICTAQALLAIVSGMYAVYHGPKRLKQIAARVHSLACTFRAALLEFAPQELRVESIQFFDTVKVAGSKDDIKMWHSLAALEGYNFRPISDTQLSVSFDECSTDSEVEKLVKNVFCRTSGPSEKLAAFSCVKFGNTVESVLPGHLLRASPYLTHPVFHRYHSETEMLRYMRKLESRDLSLSHSMIPLGSCTMKLNATSEMIPVTDSNWSQVHPFAPVEQLAGYTEMMSELASALREITGFQAVSFQPNSGAQGEYAGLLTIRKYHESRGESGRHVCLIPESAHGTNPASAAMAGLAVEVVACDQKGNVELEDLRAKAEKFSSSLCSLMITYPSTHGVFEESVKEICEVVHHFGGQVYMDGANMNAQVGLCRPFEIGADLCHLNLHKTFSIPHGGGGPGVGPICVAEHLASFLPSSPINSAYPFAGLPQNDSAGAVSAAPWGSANILLISWAYIRMMGPSGLALASKVAILNANYIAKRLQPHYEVVYRGKRGLVAHECLIDLRPFKKTSGIDVEDVAKRLIDYGFHSPTMSFPIAGTLMIEPTESESLHELDRFCEAMICIREEIRKVEIGHWPKDQNPLKGAPHTADVLSSDDWTRPYSRELALFPTKATKEHKFFPFVGRVNNALGDRKLICTCPPAGVR